MIHKNLLDILARQGFTRDGDVFHLGNGHGCSVYLAYADESLILDRITAVEVTPEIAVLVTQRRERFAVELSEIRC
ncbi:MAG TPA: hypothetical protein VHE35_06365, partial [Kofleriaceae bacterium]|nr:hypothetical protein [Kofleriaceae bacterium]